MSLQTNNDNMGACTSESKNEDEEIVKPGESVKSEDKTHSEDNTNSKDDIPALEPVKTDDKASLTKDASSDVDPSSSENVKPEEHILPEEIVQPEKSIGSKEDGYLPNSQANSSPGDPVVLDKKDEDHKQVDELEEQAQESSELEGESSSKAKEEVPENPSQPVEPISKAPNAPKEDAPQVPEPPQPAISQVQPEGVAPNQEKGDHCDNNSRNPFIEAGEQDTDEFSDLFGPDHSLLHNLEGATGATASTELTDAYLSHAQRSSTRTAVDRDETPKGMAEGIELHEHQKIALHWLKKQEANTGRRGGILADEMGLGKTVELIALMVSRPFERIPVTTSLFQRFGQADTGTPNAPKCNGATLIVAPVSLLRQWRKEIMTKTEPKLKALIFGKADKLKASSFEQYDVVLVSYEALGMDWDRKENGKDTFFFDPRFKFYRIILDEAHKIKNRLSKMSLACRELKAEYRWYVSGTPIQNGLFELFPALSFLRVIALDTWPEFNDKVMQTPFVEAVQRVHNVLRNYLLRRTKSDTVDEKPIITLPGKEETILQTQLDAAQRNVYDELETAIQLEFLKYKQETNQEINFKTTRILRLRQICLHPWLMNFSIGDGLRDSPLDEQRLARNAAYNFTVEHIKRILDILQDLEQSGGDFKCEKCSQHAVSRLIPGCGHGLCFHCYDDFTMTLDQLPTNSPHGYCPICSTPYRKLFITTLIAFKCAWVPGFRRDEWDEDEMERRPPFDQFECFQPLIADLASARPYLRRPRFVDSRIWGQENIASIQQYFEDAPDDFLSALSTKLHINAINGDEQNSQAKRKLEEVSADSDIDSVSTLIGTTPNKRHCGAAEHESKSGDFNNDGASNMQQSSGQQLPLTNIISQDPVQDRESLWVTQTADIDMPDANTTPQSTFYGSANTTEQGSSPTIQTDFSLAQQDCPMSPHAYAPDELSLLQMLNAHLGRPPVSFDENGVPIAIPEFQLRASIGQLDLPYNYPRLKSEAHRNADRKWRYLSRLIKDKLPDCAKINKLMVVLQEKQAQSPNDRIIIFSEFTTMLDFVEAWFRMTGRDDHVRYDGTMSAEQKDGIVKDFMNTRNKTRVLLCSLRSGNVGLNLTSANHVIFMEPFWNPYVQDQAVDRCHRIGQTKTVYITHMVVPNSVEERILTVQAEKRKEVGQVLNGEKITAANTKLTSEDMDFIVGINGARPGASSTPGTGMGTAGNSNALVPFRAGI